MIAQKTNWKFGKANLKRIKRNISLMRMSQLLMSNVTDECLQCNKKSMMSNTIWEGFAVKNQTLI